MSDFGQAQGKDGSDGRGDWVAERLARLDRRARAAIAWETLWPRLAAALVVIAVFLSLSWLGLWLNLPNWGRIVGVALFASALVAAMWPLRRFPAPGAAESLARIDRDSALAHRPARALTDALAMNSADPGTRALWEAHRARLSQAAAALKVDAPRPRLSDKDPWAIRFAALLALVGAFFVAGAEREARLRAAFDWSSGPGTVIAHRLDGWIDPPAYTQFPPLLLDFSGKTETASALSVRVPLHSTLVIRSSGGGALEFGVSGALEAKVGEAKPAQAAGGAPAPASGEEKRWMINGDSRLAIRRDGAPVATVTIAAIPDVAPTIELDGEVAVNGRGSFTVPATMADDYGVVAAEARFSNPRLGAGPAKAGRAPLVPPPVVALALPGGDHRKGETKTMTDLSAHPWAGATVELTLVARDELGQEGFSRTSAIILPQRSFSKPLARALIEQRRDLVLDPDRRAHVQEALYALMIAPDRFTDASAYLGLRVASTRLKQAKTDPELIEVADYLWDMALQIEDGDLSDAEKALRQAQDALKQALDRDASPDEIKKLTQELRQAMDKFLREFAEKSQRDKDQATRQDRSGRAMSRDDLQSMLDRLEDMAKRGDMADAQQLLDELRNILESLQAARPNDPRDQAAREMSKKLDELDAMTREQQDLRDKTFREGQRQRQDGGKEGQRRGQQDQQGQSGQQGQQGQSGQQGRRGQQGGQQGQQREQGEGVAPGQSGEGPEQDGQGLGERQQGLRQQLEAMKRRMRELGANPEQGLEDAEDAMRDAEGALGKGDGEEAVEAQGRALDGLRKGAQGLAQQMQQMQDGEEGSEQAGQQPGPGQPGNRRAQGGERDDDPLGRPTRSPEAGDRSKLRRAGKDGMLELRAREVLDELRRRLGDPSRSQEELDYLNRLLRAR